MFKALKEKWTCKHDWEVVAKTVYKFESDRYLLICKKCGKIKKVRL